MVWIRRVLLGIRIGYKLYSSFFGDESKDEERSEKELQEFEEALNEADRADELSSLINDYSNRMRNDNA